MSQTTSSSDPNPHDELILAKVCLKDRDSNPLSGERLSILPRFVPLVSPDAFVLGHQTMELITDQNGHAEHPMVRGTEVLVFRESTGEVWTVLVPATGDSFDLIG